MLQKDDRDITEVLHSNRYFACKRKNSEIDKKHKSHKSHEKRSEAMADAQVFESLLCNLRNLYCRSLFRCPHEGHGKLIQNRVESRRNGDSECAVHG